MDLRLDNASSVEVKNIDSYKITKVMLHLDTNTALVMFNAMSGINIVLSDHFEIDDLSFMSMCEPEFYNRLKIKLNVAGTIL